MKAKKQETIADMNARMHRIGRLWLLIGLLLIGSVPVWMCLFYETTPDWSVFSSAAVISPFILMALSGIAEPIIYAPMIGINSMYSSFLTGNLSNLKIPCVVKAQEIAGTKIGTEENEIVATLAVATSSLLTIVVIAVMVMLLAIIPNLQQSIDNAEYLTPAFGCVVYALFGSLGGKYIAKNPKLAIFPAILGVIVAIVLAAGFNYKLGSEGLFVGIGLTIVFALVQLFREKKKIKIEEEKKRLAAIAAGMSYERLIEIERSQAEEAKATQEAEREARKAEKAAARKAMFSKKNK